MGTVFAWIFVVAVGTPVLFFAVAGFQWWTRGTPLRRIRSLDGGASDGAPAAGSDDFLESVGPHLGVRFDPGHDLELFFCGDEVYPKLLDDLAGAEELITWHVFWFKPGDLADRVKEALASRAREGVRVLFLYDWFGSIGIDRDYFRELEEAGVEVRAFRRPGLGSLYKSQQRSHVRTVVIDGVVGYTGGFAIADEWLGDGRSPGEWRDTSVRLTGPAVHRLQVAFAVDWVESTGELLTGPGFFPDSTGGFPDRGDGADSGSSHDHSAADGESLSTDPSDDVRTHRDCWAALFQSSPSLGGTAAERLFALSLSGARDRLWITAGYFVPDEGFTAQLVDAARRGVDVRILHPGGRTDRAATWYAARRRYDALLEGGVRIWEYEPTVIHAKTLVADESWCAVGTPNFDNRSMSLNDEVSLLVRDEGVTALLAERFEDDLTRSREVELEEHRRRGAWERGKEWIFARFAPLL